MNKNNNKSTISIIDSRIGDYVDKMTSQESENLQELVESSANELEFIDMLSGNSIAQLLKMLIKISGAKRVLEVGTFTGYSALAMAEVLPEDGTIITLEMNEQFQEIATNHFKRYDQHKKIIMMKGNARDLLDGIEGIFDFIFLDADKVSYPLYYEKLLSKLTSGGILAADNTLWGGSVLNPNDQKSEAIHDFNKMVAEDKRVDQIMIPLRDGITIIQKK
ncbi:MAG: class I SAM-dependent methyltransferase [Balneolaceae bacterium]